MTMRIAYRRLGVVCTLVGVLAMSAAPVLASPIAPTRDDEVIDVLPATAGSRTEERRLLQSSWRNSPATRHWRCASPSAIWPSAHELGDPSCAVMACPQVD